MNNIKKLYLANFIIGLVFWYGIEKLFMRSIGISALGIAVNAIVYVAITSIFEIPTGILADRWNRKYTLMIGMACLAISSAILGASHGLTLYILGTAIWGLYSVFVSGTFEAMMYDSLHELGRADEYVKHQGRSYGMFLVGISLSSVVGGYIAQHLTYRASYYLTIIPCLVGLVVLWRLREPSFHKDVEDTKLRQHVKRTIHKLTGQQYLLYLSMLFVTAEVLTSTQNEYSGLYYIALGLGAIGNGYANAGKWLFGSFGQFLSNKFAPYTKYLIYVFFGSFVIFTVWRSPLGIVFFYLAAFSQAVMSTNLEGVIQQQTPSSIRATTLSVLSFAGNLVLIPLSLVFGLLARTDVFHAYQFFAVIGLIFAFIWLVRPKPIKLQTLHPVGLPLKAVK